MKEYATCMYVMGVYMVVVKNPNGVNEIYFLDWKESMYAKAFYLVDTGWR